MKHTQGKWTVHNPATERRSWGDVDKRLMVLHPDGERLICRLDEGCTSKRGTIPMSEKVANAHLIAAAPEMYEALVKLRDWCEREGVEMPVAATAALAKAEGGEV